MNLRRKIAYYATKVKRSKKLKRLDTLRENLFVEWPEEWADAYEDLRARYRLFTAVHGKRTPEAEYEHRLDHLSELWTRERSNEKQRMHTSNYSRQINLWKEYMTACKERSNTMNSIDESIRKKIQDAKDTRPRFLSFYYIDNACWKEWDEFLHDLSGNTWMAVKKWLESIPFTSEEVACIKEKIRHETFKHLNLKPISEFPYWAVIQWDDKACVYQVTRENDTHWFVKASYDSPGLTGTIFKDEKTTITKIKDPTFAVEAAKKKGA